MNGLTKAASGSFPVYPLLSLALHSEKVWSSVAGGGGSGSLGIERCYTIRVQTKTKAHKLIVEGRCVVLYLLILWAAGLVTRLLHVTARETLTVIKCTDFHRR